MEEHERDVIIDILEDIKFHLELNYEHERDVIIGILKELIEIEKDREIILKKVKCCIHIQTGILIIVMMLLLPH